ncbi:MAG: hypothetical protein V9G19_18355 [Tetrasphaera sp.]
MLCTSSCRGTPTSWASRPYVSAFKIMGIPYADHIMNAVVLTAVLSCLNSGLYTASPDALRARRPPRGSAPAARASTDKGVPRIRDPRLDGGRLPLRHRGLHLADGRSSSFLLNSSGAVILFVYMLIAVLQFVLRRRTDAAGRSLPVRRCGLFPCLTIVADRRDARRPHAHMARSARTPARRSSLGLASWAFLLVVFRLIKGYREKVVDAVEVDGEPTPVAAHRLLVLANDELEPAALLAQVHLLSRSATSRPMSSCPRTRSTRGLRSSPEPHRSGPPRSRWPRHDSTRWSALCARPVSRPRAVSGTSPRPSPSRRASAPSRPDSILVVRNSEDSQMLVPNDVVAQARESLCIPVYSVVGRPGLPDLAHPHLVDPVETRSGGGA